MSIPAKEIDINSTLAERLEAWNQLHTCVDKGFASLNSRLDVLEESHYVVVGQVKINSAVLQEITIKADRAAEEAVEAKRLLAEEAEAQARYRASTEDFKRSNAANQELLIQSLRLRTPDSGSRTVASMSQRAATWKVAAVIIAAVGAAQALPLLAKILAAAYGVLLR